MSEKSQLFSRIALDWSDPEQVLKVIENRKRRARPKLEANFVAPSTPIQKQLTEIWIEVLGIERVGIHDNFFKLGGDSLLATQVVSRIRGLFRVELPLRSSFELPTVAGLAERIERHLEASGEETTGKIEPRKQTDIVPLSFAQQRLWFMDQLAPGSGVYNITGSLRVRGALEVKALERAFNEVVRRHETLRTSFENDHGRPRLLISPALLLRIPTLDLTELPEDARETEVRRVTGAEAQRPFDLTQAPLLRVMLVRLSVEEFVMLYAIHHIIADGWSLGVLITEVTALYEAFLRGGDPPLAALPIQYGDYAIWQQQWFKGEKLQTQLDYWTKQLSGAVPLLELPMVQPRPKVQRYRGAQMAFSVPAVLTEQLKKVSQAEGVTLFMTLLAAFQVLLYRYSGLKDIVVGTATANRRRVETERLIGCFLNMLALRTDLSGNPRFSELLVQVKEMTLAAYVNQDVPFERVVEELQLERSLDHAPLFQHMLLLQNAPRQELYLPGLTMTAEKSDTGTAKLDFTLALNEGESGLAGWLEYNTDLFTAANAAQLLKHLLVLLEGIAARPYARLSELPLLTGSERRRLLVEWNQTNTDHDLGQPVQRLIEAQAAQVPDRVAVRFKQEQLTYRELNERANQLAHYLKRLGVGAEVRVGVMLDRSLDMVVALLGVLKAGGAYVPLDPAYPERRLSFLMADAELSVLLVENHFNANAGDSVARVVALDREWESIACESRDNPSVVLSENNLAYLIYTSGSTGVPKGVQITHGSLINLLCSMKERPGMRAGETLLAVTTLSFDIAGLELYLPLIVGGQIVIMSQAESGDALRLSESLMREGASVMQATPVTWQMLLATGWKGAAELKILCGGEALTRALADRLLERGKGGEVWNLYGPTETTIWSAVWPVAAGTEPVYIGRPISNTQLYILDEHLEPVPVDVIGQLYIGGAGLSRGYWRRSELTAEQFIPDPFSATPGARLYRTGDLTRYRANGEIEFLGRVDQQVKLRGYRIELGELENVLRQHEDVAEAVVVVRGNGVEQRLVGYLVPQAGRELEVGRLRAYLSEQVPHYMVPGALVVLDQLPLTANGKVDRRALPAEEPRSGSAAGERAAGRAPTVVEEVVAGIWSEVLGVEEVGLEDNFFELGGHSLLATQVVSRVREMFGVEVPARRMFEGPTVAAISATIEKANGKLGQMPTKTVRKLKRDLYRVKLIGQDQLSVPENVRKLL